MFWLFKRTPKGWHRPSAKWKCIHRQLFVGEHLRHIQAGYQTDNPSKWACGIELQFRREGVPLQQRALYMAPRHKEGHVLILYDDAPPPNQCHEYTLWVRASPGSSFNGLIKVTEVSVSTINQTSLVIRR